MTDQVVVTVIATGLEDDDAPVVQPQPVQPQPQQAPTRRMPQSQQRMVQQPQQPQPQQATEENKPTRRFADLDDFESEIKIPDFLTRKRF